MSEVAELIADMVRAGVAPELIGRTAEALAGSPPERSAHARRQERYRDRKASQNVTCDAGDASDALAPSPKESPQTPKETPPFQPTTQQENPLRGQKKASRLPSGWVLPDDWRVDAADAGLPSSQIDLEASKMRDWSASSKNGAKLDWRAVWRNWCREAATRLPRSRGSPMTPKTAADFLFAETMDNLNGYSGPNGPQAGDRADAGEFPGFAIAGTARRLGLPSDG